MQIANDEMGTDGVADLPQSALERTVAAVWMEVLELDELDVHAELLELGVTSIQLLMVLKKLRQALGFKVSMSQLLQAKNVTVFADQMARLIASGDAGRRIRRTRREGR